MLKPFKAGLATAMTAAMLGGSMLFATPAMAATHQVSDSMVTNNISVKVGGHSDKLALTAVSKKSGVLYDSQYKLYAPKEYRIKLTHGKQVLYKGEASTWVALGTQIELTTHKKFASDKALVAQVKKDLHKSAKDAKPYTKLLVAKAQFQLVVAFGLYAVAGDLNDYAKANPDATDFSGYGKPLSYSKDGLSYTVTGTPQHFQVNFASTKAKESIIYDSAAGKVVKADGYVEFHINSH